MSQDADPGRRRLLSGFLGGSIAALCTAIVYPVLRYLSPPRIPEATTRQVEAGPVNDPELLDKGYKIVRFGAEPVILVRAAEGDHRAFAATCTHLDCIVEYRPADQQLVCNCHNGRYDLTGRNVSGPPPRPLARYQVHEVPGSGGRPATLVVSRS